jgi:ankyrin repeat protein
MYSVFPALRERANSALIAAAHKGDTARVEQMLQRGADINARDARR